MPRTNPKLQIKNPSLQKLSKDINKKQILGVALDISKEFHRVILCDFNGKLLGRHFSIDNMKTGYEKLQRRILSVSKRIKSKQIIIGMEPIGAYSENISNHLKKDYKNVFFIHAVATASNRNQKLLMGQKTDDIDCSSIADLLIRGECTPCNPGGRLYFELKEKIYWREKKLNMLVKLKNQIIRRLDIIYPGLDSKFEGNKPLFVKIFEGDIPNILMELAMPPEEISKFTPKRLSQLCKDMGYYFSENKACRTINYFNNLLIPDKKNTTTHLEILKKDVYLLKTLEKEIKVVEERIIELAKRTPAKIIFGQIKGISDIMVASYIGLIGNLNNFKNAGKIYSKAGLSPKVSQSGSSPSKKLGIKRAGNKTLRTTLFKMATMVAWKEPVFKDYYDKIKNGKSRRESLIAVSNKLNRILFAMMKKQEPFKPTKH